MTQESRKTWQQWLDATFTAAVTGCFVLITYLHATFPTKEAIAKRDANEEKLLLLVRDELRRDIRGNRETLDRVWVSIREVRNMLRTDKIKNRGDE